MKIKIDKELCISCGTCVALCPDNFKMDDGEKAEVIKHEDSECVQNAISSCAVQAITIN